MKTQQTPDAMVSKQGARKGERNCLFQPKPKTVMKEDFSCSALQLIESWHEMLNSIQISYSGMTHKFFLTDVQEWLTFAFGISIFLYQLMDNRLAVTIV